MVAMGVAALWAGYALGMVSVHVPDQADTVTEAQPSGAPAIGSDKAPAKVVAGSVTG